MELTMKIEDFIQHTHPIHISTHIQMSRLLKTEKNKKKGLIHNV